MSRILSCVAHHLERKRSSYVSAFLYIQPTNLPKHQHTNVSVLEDHHRGVCALPRNVEHYSREPVGSRCDPLPHQTYPATVGNEERRGNGG